MWLLIIFIAIPLIEIALFIQVGGFIGLWPTLATVVITAILGASLVRRQGLQTIAEIQNAMGTMNDPSKHIAHGAMILVAGVVLLTPGFFTDAVGFLLLVPAVREGVIKHFAARIIAQATSARQSPNEDTVINAEYKDVTEKNDPSGWTKH